MACFRLGQSPTHTSYHLLLGISQGCSHVPAQVSASCLQFVLEVVDALTRRFRGLLQIAARTA